MTSNQLIHAKIKLPYSGVELIERSGLLEKLDNSYRDKKLIFVTAPAGYGKTSLIYQFAKKQKISVVWYQLDNFDNEPELFINYLIEAICEKIKGFDKKIINNYKKINRQLMYHKLLAFLISELEKKAEDGIIIILEDFHLITESSVISMVEYLINYMPTGVHIIINSRFKPNLSLSKLITNNHILEIDHNELRFSNDEIACMLDRKGITNISQDIVKKLVEKTERWALGLTLSFTLFKDPKHKNLIDDFTLLKTQEEIYSYLALEVFRNLPEGMRYFLICTSVLNSITPEACDYLLERTDSKFTLNEIEKKNLYIERANSVEPVYRFHHMFRDFLSEQLTSQNKKRLLTEAGNYYLSKNLFEIAAQYYISSYNIAAIATVTKKTGFLMLKNGRINLVDNWLKILDGTEENEDPTLILIRGAVFTYQGKFDEAENLILKASAMIEASGDLINISRLIILKVRVMQNRVSFKHSLNFINESLQKLKGLPLEYYIEAVVEQVYNKWLTGDINGAFETTEETIAEDKSHSKEMTFQLYAGIVLLHFVKGEYTKALSHFEKILSDFPVADQIMWESFGMHIALIYRGRGELEKARSIMLKTLERKKAYGVTRDLHNSYYFLALLYIDFSDKKSADEYFSKAIENFCQSGGKLNYYLLMLRSVRAALITDSISQHDTEKLIEEAINVMKGNADYLLSISLPYYAIYFIRRNMFEKADCLLNQALDLTERIGVRQVYAKVCGLKGYVLLKLGKKEMATSLAINFIKISSSEACIQNVVTYPELRYVISIGIEHNIEGEFIEKLILKLNTEAIPILEELTLSDDTAICLRSIFYLELISKESAYKNIDYMFFNQKQQSYVVEMIKAPSMNKFFINSLGDFKMYHSSNPCAPISWRTSKACELFAYFFHHKGKLMSKEKILDDLWLGENAKQTLMLLYTNVHNIRKVFKAYGIEDGIISGQNGYSIDFSYFTSDYDCFEFIIKEIQSKKDQNIQLIEKAISLYNGDYIQNKDWHWAESKREKLRKNYLYLLQKAAKFNMCSNSLDKAEKYLKLILIEEPYLEDTYIELMTAYNLMGDKKSIKKTYNDLSQILMRDLNIKPNKDTESMYLKLMK